MVLERETTISKNDNRIAVVIPTLNEEKGIAVVIDKIHEALKNYNYDIIVSDGRSKDKTVESALKHNAKVIYQRRKGYGDALIAGYMYAIEELGSDILVNLDADGTYEPNDIPKLIDKIIANEADYVVGKRIVSAESMKRSHIFGNKAISFLIQRLLKVNVTDTQSGLFAFRSYLIRNIESWATSGWALNTELLTKAAENEMIIREVDISYYPRIGEAHNTTIGGGIANLTVIIRMLRDTEPLRMLGIVGSIMLAIGVGIGGIVVYDFVQTGTVKHTSSAILAALLIIMGVQVFSLGLVADMVKRRQLRRIRPANSYYLKK
jgi:glycosyltransferase involved in cell wall biosynthesis